MITMSLARRRRRIRNLANLGFLPFGFAMAMLESNDARLAVAALAVVYAVAVNFWLLRANRCPGCGSLLSTRDLRLRGAKITVPWFFRSTCRRCGWSESSAQGAASTTDSDERSVL
jgi:hypothetical protein